MKRSTYNVLALVSWATFFAKVWKNFPWDLVCGLVGLGALYFTVKLYTGHEPKEKTKGSLSGRAIILAFCWALLLWILSC